MTFLSTGSRCFADIVSAILILCKKNKTIFVSVKLHIIYFFHLAWRKLTVPGKLVPVFEGCCRVSLTRLIIQPFAKDMDANDTTVYVLFSI